MRRRKKRLFWVAALSAILLLGGCDFTETVWDFAQTQWESVTNKLQISQIGDAASDTLSEKSGGQAEEAAAWTGEAAASEEAAEQLHITAECVSADCYAYATLDEETRLVYDEIYQTIREQEESVRVSTLDAKVLEAAYKAVNADHGGVFWVSGYVYTQYTRGEELVGIDFAPNYTMEQQEREELQTRIDARVAEILSGISMEASDYEKARYVYDYLASNVEYDDGASDNQNIISVFINGQTVCQGYACATQYLLEKLGVQAAIVTGRANGAPHAWNLVRMDGAYYYIDTTWGNSSYTVDTEYKERFVNYNYFGVTTEEISVTHEAEVSFALPECTATQDNYYVREGCYFSEWSPDAIGALCADGYETGDSAVSVKLATSELLAQVRQYFVDDRHITDYCPGLTSLYYIVDEQQNVFIFRF